MEAAEEIVSTPGVKGCMIGIGSSPRSSSPRSVSRDSLCVLSPFVPAGDLFVDLGFGSRIFSGKPMLSEENLPYLQAAMWMEDVTIGGGKALFVVRYEEMLRELGLSRFAV